MSYEETSSESLQALKNVVQICLPAFPCHRESCKRCSRSRLLTELGNLLMGGDR